MANSPPVDPNLYDYRNPTTTPSPEPILYDYTPTNGDSSEEDRETTASNPNDYFVVGVENMVLLGNYIDDRHLVVVVVQESDGLPLLDPTEDESAFEVEQYFPDAEFVFFADDEPSKDDLSALNSKLNEMIRERKC